MEGARNRFSLIGVTNFTEAEAELIEAAISPYGTERLAELAQSGRMLDDDLEVRLREAARREDFLDIPFETLVRQLKADMDLSGALRLTACTAPPPPDPGGLVYDTAPPNTG